MRGEGKEEEEETWSKGARVQVEAWRSKAGRN